MESITAWFTSIGNKIVAALLSFHMSIGGALVVPVPIKIVTQPAVFIVSSEEYAVMWATDKRGTGGLIVTTDGVEKTFYDSASGSIRSDDTLHVVKVKKAVLDNCDSYKVQSQYVWFSLSYFAIKGKQATSPSYTFRGSAESQETVRALYFTDVHGHKEQALANEKKLLEDAGAQADLLIFAGDITRDWILVQDTFRDEILDLAAQMTGGGFPVIYARGNHETRGQWATEMRKYFPTKTGEMYYTATYGPIHFTVLDSGEDKQDDHAEYAGLADFAAYRAQEKAWLDSLKKEGGGEVQYRVCICHEYDLNSPGLFENWWAPLKDNLEITNFFCGHGHDNKIFKSPNDLTCYEDGGPTIGSLLTFVNGTISAKSAQDGAQVRDFGVLA
ncbi:MAG: metallophosphoesterase [Oscillospiraceae bacterium]|jgi:hypothetical protein|nr:metallophosphoesterase [Oscillospiraceae bacterium]